MKSAQGVCWIGMLVSAYIPLHVHAPNSLLGYLPYTASDVAQKINIRLTALVYVGRSELGAE